MPPGSWRACRIHPLQGGDGRGRAALSRSRRQRTIRVCAAVLPLLPRDVPRGIEFPFDPTASQRTRRTTSRGSPEPKTLETQRPQTMTTARRPRMNRA